MDDREQAFLLREVDRWDSEGLLTPDQAAALRARYAVADERAPPSAGSVAGVGPGAGPRRGPGTSGRATAASDWLQLVGGLLVGAGLVAFVLFLGIADAQRAYVLLGLGVLAFAAGFALDQRWPERRGLSEATLAAGLVAIGVASPMSSSILPNGWGIEHGPGIVAALAGILAMWLRKGASPIVVIGAIVFALGTFMVTRPGDNLNSGAFLWWGLLLAFGAFTLLWRGEAWANVTLAILVAPLAGAQFMSLDRLGVHDSLSGELWLGLQFAILIAAGAFVGARGLVAGAAAALTIDAIAFSFNVGGPLTALVLLLALGGTLVWQAEFLRRYFHRHSAPP